MSEENELTALDVTGEQPPDINLEEQPPVEDPEKPPGGETVDEAPDPTTLKAEVEELEKRKEAAKERALYWRKQKTQERADYFRGRKAEEPPPAQAETPARPNQDDFDDYNDYVDALTDWKVEHKKSEWDQAEVEKTQNEVYQQKMTKLQEGIDRGFEKYDDFESVALAENVPITPVIKDILAELDEPADIAYYLGKNHTECIAISRMTPIAAARAIAKIETELAAAPSAQPKKTTSAPPPVKPVSSGGSAVSKDPNKMSQAEYEEYRRSQGARLF